MLILFSPGILNEAKYHFLNFGAKSEKVTLKAQSTKV